MTQRTLKYGLTAALRPIAVPDTWDGTVHTTHEGFSASTTRAPVANGLIASGVEAPHEALRVGRGATGTLTITRTVQGAAAQHTTILVAPETVVAIHERILGEGTFAGATTLILGQGARVEYAQLLSLTGTAFIAMETTIANAQLRTTQAVLGETTAQLVAHATIGENATVETRQVVIGTGAGQVDAHATSIHTGRSSKSDIVTRGILDDSSRAIFHGLIRIEPEASDVDSYQKTEVILLSETAGADAIPNLEIHDHRVRCSHGASIGRLDSEKLFYLMSHGVSEAHAKRMITEGFIIPLLPGQWAPVLRDALGFTTADD